MAQNTTQNCLGYVKFVMIIVEKNERRKRGKFKEEWYWNGYLIRMYR